jgi:hypothetical protein
MSSGEMPPQASLGFLTVVEHEEHGLVGGYLLLNTAGRPMEFHCTAPVKPNRAQQILFGPTLQSYLYGEQIGQTLITKSSLEPLVVCTDVVAALAVRDYVATPVAFVVATPDEAPTGASLVWRVDTAQRDSSHLHSMTLGRNQLAVCGAHEGDLLAIAERLQCVCELDLAEPFERIREAVEEAHKGAR